MLEDFKEGKFYIRIDLEDEHLLKDLQDKIKMTWNSGDELASAITVSYLEKYKTIFIKSTNNSKSFHYERYDELDDYPCVTIVDFLEEKTISINEHDWLEVLH